MKSSKRQNFCLNDAFELQIEELDELGKFLGGDGGGAGSMALGYEGHEGDAAGRASAQGDDRAQSGEGTLPFALDEELEGIKWGSPAEDAFSKVSARCAVGDAGLAGSFEPPSFMLGNGRASASASAAAAAAAAVTGAAAAGASAAGRAAPRKGVAIYGRRKRKRLGADRTPSLGGQGGARGGSAAAAAAAQASSQAALEKKGGKGADAAASAAPARRRRGR